MRRLKEWYLKRKQREQQKELYAIEDSFNVSERNGKLYLVQWGTAFAEIDDTASAFDVVAMLDEARNAARDYKKGERRGNYD